MTETHARVTWGGRASHRVPGSGEGQTDTTTTTGPPKMEAITERLAVVESVIAQEKAELNTAEGDKASDLRLSLAELRDEKAALIARIATFDELVLIKARADALVPAPAPAPGKNPPLAVDASVPPLYANTQHPPLVVASLSSSTRFNFVSNLLARFKSCVELELRVRTRLVRPSFVEG